MKKEADIKKQNINIDIIMPNYNKDKFIKEAIDSVINQDYKNWRLIVIDGASTDNSEKILKTILLDGKVVKMDFMTLNLKKLKLESRHFQALVK